MRRRVLFVDNQSELLHNTRRMLFNVEDEWDIDFAVGARVALQKLSKESYDIIVTDMEMPGMDGASLLTEVAQRYPSVIRIVQSGCADNDLVLKAAGNTHQYLAESDTGNHLLEVLQRALSLRELLHDDRLAEIIAGLDAIPSLPSAYTELMEVLQRPSSSMYDIGHVIAKDVAMSAKIMQMVNSAFFGLPVEVKDPIHATNLLGIEMIKALVMTVHVFKSFANKGSTRFSIDDFTNHSLSVGALAKAIAISEGKKQDIVDDAFIAGVMHDIGKLILVANFPDYFDKSAAYAEEHGLTFVYGEEQVYNTTHAEIGAYLLGLWGFRDNIVEAVAFHHRPVECSATVFSPLTAVHIADAIENEYGGDQQEGMATIHMDYLVTLGLTEKVGEWRKVCIESQHSLMQPEE